MKTTTSKIAVAALLGAFVAAPVMAQEATMPATPPTTATPATTPEAATTAEPAADAVRVTGTVAEAAGDGKSYSVEVVTQSGKSRPIAVDASAVTGAPFAVGDTVSITGTLDADQTKLTASAITKADAAGQ
ncbi:hypothetical protein [Asticcacaulis endophyticus]|uniref:DUF5666 domain-containing protein n=1 Tax=Asticcacaulis endophyticus TaxID=1395890 RepID=A0A918UXP8_9CAUL|nr:hypothetical protein [Asticcacaulis endophyticus]GGZ43353.1 hypothetical protein GCM10011273_32710 [Asticcacaulis endophyticus]